MRMSGGKFDVNHEIGREYVSNLGLARPYIGAVFALLLYFAVQGGLLDQVNVPEPRRRASSPSTSRAVRDRLQRALRQGDRAQGRGRLNASQPDVARQPMAPAGEPRGCKRTGARLGAELRAQRVERSAQRVEVGAQRGHLLLQPPDARIGATRRRAARRGRRRDGAARVDVGVRPTRAPAATAEAPAPRAAAASSPSSCA